MRKIIVLYGCISGLIVIASMIIGYTAADRRGFFASEIFGYLVMLVALSIIFFGIKRARDIEYGGVIKFGKALGIGIAISGIAGAMYVLGWEYYLYLTDYAFIEDYTGLLIEKEKQAGVTGEALEQFRYEMQIMKDRYANPLYRLPMTFIEIFPVGVLISLMSSAVLRNSNILPAKA